MKQETNDITPDQGNESDGPQQWKAQARAARAAAWDATRATYQQLHDKTLEYGKATDRVIHEKPYVAIGVAFGVGLLLGFLVGGHKCSEEGEES